MKTKPRLLSVSLAAVLSVSLLIVQPASALTVFDPSNFVQNTLTAVRTLEQINNQINQLQNEAQMLMNQARNLANLDFNIVNRLRSTLATTERLIAEARGLAYDVQSMDATFARLYPEQYAATVSGDQMVRDAQERWKNTLNGLHTAMRMQAQVSQNLAKDESALSDLVKAVRTATSKQSLFVKLSPITIGTPHTMTDLARTAIDAGADALTIANTIPAMAIDVEMRTPRLANITGGLSGPAIGPITLKLVHDVYQQVARDARVPLIGCGGVSSWKDAAGFLLAGASCVQIGTASFANPKAALRVNQGLAKWAARQGVSSLSELVGTLKLS